MVGTRWDGPHVRVLEPIVIPPAPSAKLFLLRQLRNLLKQLRLSTTYRRAWAAIAPALGVLSVCLSGSAIGTAIAPAVPAAVGPMTLEIRCTPSLLPGIQFILPPSNVAQFDAHMAPASIQATVTNVDIPSARTLISSSESIAELAQASLSLIQRSTLSAVLLTLVFSYASAISLSLLVFRTRWRRHRQVAITMAAVMAASVATAALTFNSQELSSGSLTGPLASDSRLAGKRVDLTSIYTIYLRSEISSAESPSSP